MNFEYVIYSAVQTEVISLAEAKLAIKIDSTDFDDNITITSCITGGYHAITATATGSGIAVSGKKCLVSLEPVSLSAGATLDVKLQESLDNVTYTDVSGGTFTQITTANDTAIQELEYTGLYPYLRAAYTIVSAQASFSLNMILSDAASIEDSQISEYITAAREYTEEFTFRAIGSRKVKMILDDFPSEDYIKIPFSPLIGITSITYLDSSGTSATMTASESNGYIVDTNSDPGKVFMSYGCTWPSFTPYPYGAVEIIFTCGYTSSTCPKRMKDAIMKMVGCLYANRQNGIAKEDLNAIENLLWPTRLINV